MTISFMTIISALLSPKFIKKFHTKWIVIFSIFLTILGLLGFSISGNYAMLFLFAVPYGLGVAQKIFSPVVWSRNKASNTSLPSVRMSFSFMSGSKFMF